MKLLIVLFALLVTTSCTIEKRIYSKGWNVRWHKTDRVAKNDTKEVKLKSESTNDSHLAIQTDESIKNSAAQKSQLVTESVDESQEVRSNVELSTDELSDAESSSVMNNPTSTDSEDKASEENPSSDQKASQKSGKKGNAGESTGIVLMILGGLGTLTGIGLLIFALTAAYDVAEVILAILGVVVIGGVGVILLFIGIGVFVAYKATKVES